MKPWLPHATKSELLKTQESKSIVKYNILIFYNTKFWILILVKTSCKNIQQNMFLYTPCRCLTLSLFNNSILPLLWSSLRHFYKKIWFFVSESYTPSPFYATLYAISKKNILYVTSLFKIWQHFGLIILLVACRDKVQRSQTSNSYLYMSYKL